MNSNLIICLILFYILFNTKKEYFLITENFGCGKCGTSQSHTEDDDHIHCSESKPCPENTSCNSEGICSEKSIENFAERPLINKGPTPPGTGGRLGECEGHCNSSIDCKTGLNCFFRLGTNMKVPGCSGKGIPDYDYCVKPFLTKTTQEKSLGTYTPPLEECVGHCDSDIDCNSSRGLRCLKRNGDEKVPGCSGKGTSGKSYCYKIKVDETKDTRIKLPVKSKSHKLKKNNSCNPRLKEISKNSCKNCPNGFKSDPVFDFLSRCK